MKRLIVIWWDEPNSLPHEVFDKDYFNQAPLSMDIERVLAFDRQEHSLDRIVKEFDSENNILVVVDTKYLDFYGYTHPAGYIGNIKPVIKLLANKIKKFGPLTAQIARWTLAHEMGHWKGLEHHSFLSNPFCTMARPNYLSFGSFCSSCSSKLGEFK